jgi:hypothetical protein
MIPSGASANHLCLSHGEIKLSGEVSLSHLFASAVLRMQEYTI